MKCKWVWIGSIFLFASVLSFTQNILNSEAKSEIALTTKTHTATPSNTPTVLRIKTATPTRKFPLPSATPTLKTTKISTPLPDLIQSVLANTVKILKGKSVKITKACSYEGSLMILMSDSMSEIVRAAIQDEGIAYKGIYNSKNGVIVVQSADNRTPGNLTIIIEPQSSMPNNAEGAKKQLQTLFPGIMAPITHQKAITTTFVFYGTSRQTSYKTGFTIYKGIIFAYVFSGSERFQSLVKKD